MSIIPRLIIDGSGSLGSPLRVSAVGKNANNAQFGDLIFDGNQPPLRLWGIVLTTVAGITWNHHLLGQNTLESSPVPLFTAPSGTTAIFMVSWKKNDPAAINNYHASSSQSSANGLGGGSGGSICSNTFIALGFNTGAPAVPDTPAGSNFVAGAIMKNCY